MNKVLYNITISIDASVEKEWLKWMKDVHIPEVMQTGFFSENRICRMQDDAEQGGLTYAVQYVCNSMEDFQDYQANYAPALQAEHTQRYQGKFAAFRTVLEIIHEHPLPTFTISAN